MIYGVGETVLDILFRDDKPQTAVPGGSTFNSMISLGRMGCECLMLSQCGDDHVGDLTLDYLRTNGVSTEGLTRVPQMKSHLSLAFLDEHSDAHYSFYKDHRGWDLDLLTEAADKITFTSEDVLLFGSYFAVNPVVRPVVERLLYAAHAAGALVYYDLNYRAAHAHELEDVRQYILENMVLSTVIRASMDDLRVVFGEDVVPGYDLLPFPNRNSGPERLLIVSDGPRPLRIFRRNHVDLELATPPITPVSTVGAGDNFNAGFICCFEQYGLPADTARWSERQILQMARMGQEFGQEVCMSWENSIRVQ